MKLINHLTIFPDSLPKNSTVVSNSGNDFFSLKQKISMLQSYSAMKTSTFKDPFKFILNIDEKLDMEMDKMQQELK